MRIFKLCGLPPTVQYLFLGNVVNNGPQSLECICLLLCYKVKYPDSFYILRGYNEDMNMTRFVYACLCTCVYVRNCEFGSAYACMFVHVCMCVYEHICKEIIPIDV